MNDAPKLDYEQSQPKRRSGFTWPPDWRRRLLIAAIAAPFVFLTTLEAARLSQSSAISYMEGGLINSALNQIQPELDQYVHDHGSVPTTLTAVPEIQQRLADDPTYLTDPWNSPYLLTTVNGKPTVMSYGRDKAPGGQGLDADATTSHPYGSELITMSQFLSVADLALILLICFGNTLLVGCLAFTGKSDTRERRGLNVLLIQFVLKAAVATVVAFLIAAVHAPSGH